MNKLSVSLGSAIGLLLILLFIGLIVSVKSCSDIVDSCIEENMNSYPYVAYLEGKNYYFFSSKKEDNTYYLYDKDNNLLSELIVGNNDSISIRKR